MSLSLSPNGKTLAAGLADKSFKLWNFLNKNEEFNYAKILPKNSAYSFDGQFLATVLDEKSIQIIDEKNQRKEFVIYHDLKKPITHIEFSSD